MGAGFYTGVFLAVADDPLFYSGKTDGIYAMFRGGAPITGKIVKPTGAKDHSVDIAGLYRASWSDLGEKSRWCLVEVAS